MQALFLVPSEVPRWMLTCLMGAPASKNQHQGLYKQGLIPRGIKVSQAWFRDPIPSKSKSAEQSPQMVVRGARDKAGAGTPAGPEGTQDYRVPGSARTAASGLTSAPRATRVSMRTAVSTVMCRQPAMRAPFRGLEAEYISRMCIRPGISFSARSRALRPQAARLMSAAGAGWTEVHELPHPINHEASTHHSALIPCGLETLGWLQSH